MSTMTKSTMLSKWPARWWPLGLLVLVLALAAVWFGLAAALADAASLRARWTVAEWREGKGPANTAEAWIQARDDLLFAAKLVPSNPQWYDDLGYLHASRANAFGEQAQGSVVWKYQQTLLNQAEGFFLTSTELRPSFPYSWGYLALAKHMQDKHDSSFWQAFDNAYRFGRAEAGIQPVLARMAFAQWGTLTDDRKAHIADMIATAQPAAGKVLLAMAEQAKVTLP
jgi:hypothetical protein